MDYTFFIKRKIGFQLPHEPMTYGKNQGSDKTIRDVFKGKQHREQKDLEGYIEAPKMKLQQNLTSFATSVP